MTKNLDTFPRMTAPGSRSRPCSQTKSRPGGMLLAIGLALFFPFVHHGAGSFAIWDVVLDDDRVVRQRESGLAGQPAVRCQGEQTGFLGSRCLRK